MTKRRARPKMPKMDFTNPVYDTGTPELHRREVVEVYGIERKRRARVMSSPIDFVFSQGWIDTDQHSAAIQFYKLWYFGGGRVNYASMNLMRVPGGTSSGDYGASMRQRYREAVDNFSSPLASHMVHHVVCIGETTTNAMRAAIRAAVDGSGRGDASHKGMRHLKTGLDDLIANFSQRRGQNAIDKFRRLNS